MNIQEERSTPVNPPPQQALFQMIVGHYVSQAIYVVAQLGIADLLSSGPRPSSELAQATGMHAPSLQRMLRMLVSFGVLNEDESGAFALTPIGELLRSDNPNSNRAVAILFAGPSQWKSWGDLLYSVRTGKDAFEHILGASAFDYLEQHPEEAKIFNEAMSLFSKRGAGSIADAYDFSSFSTIVDIGGGQGFLLAGILKANPALQGILCDLPHVVEGVKKQNEVIEVAERYEIVGGDFFVEVPIGGDLYILKSVIHDWDDEHSTRILKNCRRAMKQGGMLLLIDGVLPEPVEQTAMHQILLGSDVNMLVVANGRERTATEYRALFEAADFKLTSIRPVPGGSLSFIEGEPM